MRARPTEEISQRLSALSPTNLTEAQRALYDRNRQQMQHGFAAVETVAEDGTLLGLWGMFLHEPPWARPSTTSSTPSPS